MKRLVGSLLAVALLTTIGGARLEAEAAAKDTGTSAPGVLKVGFIPAEDARAMVRQSQAIMDRLSEKLDMAVIPFVGSDYNGVIEALRAKHIDMALLGPFSYVLATTQAPVEAFAIVVTAKTMEPYYHSIVIARKESEVTSLDALKGHTFAFVDPASTSGYMVPAAAFIQKGIVPERDLKNVAFSGGHDASVVAVAQGKVEAAAVADRIYRRACAKGLADCDQLKTVWTSQPIPENPVLYRKDLPEDLKKRIREAFDSFTNLSFGEMGTVARFEPATDATYDPLREIARTLKLDLTKMK